MRVTLNVCRWISTIRRIQTYITVTGRDSRTLTRISAAIKWDWDPPNTKLMYNRWLRWGSVQVGTFKIILQNLVCMHNVYLYMCMRMQARMYVCACTYICTHTDTYTHKVFECSFIINSSRFKTNNT